MAEVNLFGDEWDERRTRPGYTWRRRGLRRALGGELLGASLYELAPGQATWPYHWHWANEELLIVVAGNPSLRNPQGERELRPGEVVAFPRGPGGAHQVRNDNGLHARVLIVSTMREPEIAEYPDSGKLVVAAGGPPTPGEEAPLELLFRRESAIGYWDGEHAGPANAGPER